MESPLISKILCAVIGSNVILTLNRVKGKNLGTQPCAIIFILGGGDNNRHEGFF
jgi:hypothetical protein